MFAQVNALPSPQCKTPRRDGNLQAASDQARFDVGRHIVGPFDGVDVIQRFGSDMIESQLHIDTNVGIRVFVDAETGRRVLQEAMQRSDLDFSDLGQALQDIFGDQMAPSSHRRKLDSGLVKLHKGPIADRVWLFNAS